MGTRRKKMEDRMDKEDRMNKEEKRGREDTMGMEDTAQDEKRDVIGCVMRLMRTLRRTHPADRNASRGAVRLLHVLQEEDGLTSRELAERIEIRPASLTERLNRLEADGIVKRIPDEKDLRKVRVFIQAEGYRIIENAVAIRQMENDHINAVLTAEEQETFCMICEKLTRSLRDQEKGEDAS